MTRIHRDPSVTRRTEHGLGILELVVAVAILGIAGFVLASVMSNIQLSATKLSDDAEFESTVMSINDAMSCRQTLAPYLNAAQIAVCAGTPLAVRRASGGVLVATTGSRFGRWTARATCRAEEVQIELARLKPGRPLNSMNPADFENDKLTGAPLMWREATSTAASTGFCPEFFRVASATGRRFFQGSQFVAGGVGSFSIGTGTWRPRWATCLSGTHAHYPGTWHNCTCNSSVTLNSSSVTFYPFRDGTHPTSCWVNYIIWAER